MNNIEFIEDGHIYLFDGVITPSVSEVLHYIFPNKYRGVPTYILEKKAEYGSKVHEAIELYEKNIKLMSRKETRIITGITLGLNIHQEIALDQYIKLRKKYKIKPMKQEEIVHYKNYYCGRYDMEASVGIEENDCLCDVKTTSELDREYLSWQLSFYELAIGKRFKKLYCIWLPKKELGEFIEIDRIPKDKLLKKLEEFIQWKKKSMKTIW